MVARGQGVGGKNRLMAARQRATGAPGGEEPGDHACRRHERKPVGVAVVHLLPDVLERPILVEAAVDDRAGISQHVEIRREPRPCNDAAIATGVHIGGLRKKQAYDQMRRALHARSAASQTRNAKNALIAAIR